MTLYRRATLAFLMLICAAILAGCAGTSKNTTTRTAGKGGGYYKDDGPGANPPANIDAIPDAVPRIETFARANARPYSVFGKRYAPLNDNDSFRQVGTASWYGKKFHGKKTANGETYDMYAMTAAHPTLPLPSYARVTRAGSDRSVIVRINDRGPFHSSRIIDLSYAAASKLGLIGVGSGKVIVEAISNNQIARGDFVRPATKLAAADPGVRSTPAVRIGTAAASMPKTPSVSTRVLATPPRSSADLITAAPEPSSNLAATPDALTAIALPSPSSDPGVDPLQSVSGGIAARRNAAPDSLNEVGPQATSEAVGTAEPTVVDGHIYLQFGAFSTSSNARQLATRLNDQISGVEPRSAHVEPAGELYRVQVGPFASRTAAVNAALRIRNRTGVQPTIALR